MVIFIVYSNQKGEKKTDGLKVKINKFCLIHEVKVPRSEPQTELNVL